jgi:hypothetical protein
MLLSHKSTDLGRATFPKQFPVSNRADNPSVPFSGGPGPAVRRFTGRDMHCVALILVTVLNCFVLHKFDLSSLLFLLSIIHAVAESRQELMRIRRITYIGPIKRLMLAEVN